VEGDHEIEPDRAYSARRTARMSEIEVAQESLEHAAHEHASGGVPYAKQAAIVIATLAACLALAETGAKDAQTAFLTHHIGASDTWAQYQGKSGRRATLSNTAAILSSLPTKGEPEVAKRIADALANAERMRNEPGKDGMEQLAARAHDQEHLRDHEEHRHHGLEIASGGLQLSIVLVSVSVITAMRALLVGGGLLGAVAAGYGLLAALSIF
jgi:hypothetical protein